MAHPENVDVLDENGNSTGKIMSLTGTNLRGEWHAGVHIALYTRDRRVLLQQRSKAILFYPGQWELGVGGAVTAGEDLLSAARREVHEELGVTLHNLQPVTRWKYNHRVPRFDMHVKVFLHAYIAEIDPARLHLQKDEVQSLRLLPLAEVHNSLFKHKGLPHIQLLPFAGYYRQMLGAIETQFRHPQVLPSVDTIKGK